MRAGRLLWAFLFYFIFVFFVVGRGYALNSDKICGALNLTYSECDEFMNYLIANDTVVHNYTYVINNTIVQNHTYVINRTVNATVNNTINKTRIIKLVVNNTIVKYINNTSPRTSSQNFYEQLFQTLLLSTLKEKFNLNEGENVDIKRLKKEIDALKNSSREVDYNKISQIVREQLYNTKPQSSGSYNYQLLVFIILAVLFGAFIGYQYFEKKNRQAFQEEIKEEYEYPSGVVSGEKNRDKTKRGDAI